MASLAEMKVHEHRLSGMTHTCFLVDQSLETVSKDSKRDLEILVCWSKWSEGSELYAVFQSHITSDIIRSLLHLADKYVLRGSCA